jgi:hypothetical protein
VFDNVEDPDDLRPYWPFSAAGGRRLVTSRNPNWQPLAATLPVDIWPRAEAIAFLHRRVDLDRQDATALDDIERRWQAQVGPQRWAAFRQVLAEVGSFGQDHDGTTTS